MLITNASKESRKIKAAALVNELRHGSVEMPRLFSDEKNVIQVQKSNRQNDSKGDVMLQFFFQKGLRAKADIYQEMLRSVAEPWMDEIASGRPYVFQPVFAPAHKAKTTQTWLLIIVSQHWSPDLWPPSSLDCNPLLLLVGRDRGQVQQARLQQPLLFTIFFLFPYIIFLSSFLFSFPQLLYLFNYLIRFISFFHLCFILILILRFYSRFALSS
ncbi:unnamed protein product [Acanthosepion pharaonis]|uniref:Uncharacterized protein n=1 Tax=Acanthosepion pharaonis TaxID=158019 RepID=A0A812DEI2_ACAPH|nr:unnamed protein product [Sepia pharaonis]